MKVLFVTGEYPPMKGGIADYTAALAEALGQVDVESCVLTSTGAATGTRKPEVCVFPIVKKWDFGIWGTVARTIESSQAECVHIQYQTAAFGMHPAINLLPIWLRRKGIKCSVVTTFHDLRVPYLFPKAGKARQWVTEALFAGSDAAIVTNEEDYKLLKEKKSDWINRLAGRGDSQRSIEVKLVPLGNNLAVHTPAEPSPETIRAKLEIGNRETVLSYFGFLNDSKGVEVLLTSVRRLIDDGKKVKLLLIGAETGDVDPTNHTYRQRILQQIKTEGLGEAVHWTGYLEPPEVSAHLLASDICVLPFRDGASFRRTSLITALAHGLPVVTTFTDRKAGGGPSSSLIPRLQDRENVLLVPPGDTEALAAAIAELTSSPELRHQLATGGRQLGNFFSWPLVAERTKQVYEGVV